MTSFIAFTLHVHWLVIIVPSSFDYQIALYNIGLAGPVGFDPTTTGSGGLRFFSKKQRPVLTGRRALSASLNLLIYETYRPQMIALFYKQLFISFFSSSGVLYSWLCKTISYIQSISSQMPLRDQSSNQKLNDFFV